MAHKLEKDNLFSVLGPVFSVIVTDHQSAKQVLWRRRWICQTVQAAVKRAEGGAGWGVEVGGGGKGGGEGAAIGPCWR